MARVLITRHGQTKENVDGVIQGKEHGNINEEGFEQIKKLIKRLKKENIGKIISSDIPRCRITAAEISKELNIPVEYLNLIREKDNGDLIGKNHKNINWDNLEGDFETRRARGGENLKEVRERAIRFFKEISKDKSYETILMVSHGAFLKIFIGNLLGMSIYDSIFKLFVEHGSLTELEIDEKHKEGYRFNFINEKDYLQ